VLDALEDLRLRLEDRFEQVPGGVTIVLHDNPAWLSMAHPLLPAVRWSAAPAARRYLAGWAMAGEIHTLNDDWMERRSAGEDSLRALRGTAERMYCQIVLAANNEELPPLWTPRRFLTYLRWAWLIEGAAQYFTNQTSLFRAAVITRLREGERPAFPPSRRDALILGGTIFDLLDRHAGPDACTRMASRLHREGPAGNLELAFDARMREIERAWRVHLDEILYPQSESLAGSSLNEALERPDLDLGLGSPPEFSFDPGIRRRPQTSPPDQPSAEREIEEVDDQGTGSNGDGQAERQSRRRPDAGQ
jgi:hypothetical protein